MTIQDRINNFIAYNANWENFDILPYARTGEVVATTQATSAPQLNLRGQATSVTTATVTDHTTDALWCNYTKAGIWDTSSQIMPLEGVFVGWGMKDYTELMITEASILNLPEFASVLHMSMYAQDYSYAYLYFLHALPHNPPYPPFVPKNSSAAAPATVEPNPSMLFKNTAGIYSVPETYLQWMGGIWQKRDSLLPNSNFISVTENAEKNGWVDVFCDIDGAKKNVNFFTSGVYTAYAYNSKDDAYIPIKPSQSPTIMIDFSKFEKGATKLVWYGEEAYETNVLSGFGNYEDYFFKLYSIVQSAASVKDNETVFANMDLFTANLRTKLRTFTAYSYPINGLVELNAYGTYSIIGLAPEITVNLITTGDWFKVYASMWNYFYNKMVQSEEPYDKVKNAIVQYYQTTSPLISNDILNGIKEHLFYQFSTSQSNITYDLDKSKYFTDNKLFTQNADILYNVVDLIGGMVLRFINDEPLELIGDAYSERYGIVDPSFVCCLYPSAGGVNTLGNAIKVMDGYLEGLSDHIKKVPANIDTNGKPILGDDGKPIYVIRVAPRYSGGVYAVSPNRDNDFVTAMFINVVQNSCHALWYTGPYMGIDDTRVIGSDPIHSTDAASLKHIGDSFLYFKDEFTATQGDLISKDKRCYVLDPSDHFRTISASDTVMQYKDVFNYIGTNLLDEWSDEFTLAVPNAQDTLLSLLVVDRSNFTPITVNGVDYSAIEQVQLLSMYDILLSKGYAEGKCWSGGNNLHVVMNAALTNAQANKVRAVVNRVTTPRKQVNSGSVFEYLHAGGIKNEFHNVLLSAPTRPSDHGEYIRKALFGTGQTISSYLYQDDNTVELYKKYLVTSLSEEQLGRVVGFFFGEKGINVNPTENTIKIAKDFILQYCGYFPPSATPYTDGHCTASIIKLSDQILRWVTQSESDLVSCMNTLQTALQAVNVQTVNAGIKDNQSSSKGDMSKLKLQTYYNIKAIYDNWIRVNKDDTKLTWELSYNNSFIPYDNEIKQPKTSLVDQFIFVDRGNRNIGDKLLVDLNWLADFREKNFGYKNNTNISLYSFLSELGKQHGSLIHSLPAFINLGNLSASPSSDKFAGQLFDTYDYVDLIDSEPKFIFQFIGNTNTILNTPQNKELRSNSKSYSLSSPAKGFNAKTNQTMNIRDGVGVPNDLVDARAVSFVVNFGAQEQQMFSNLQLDQSEYQNTEEYFQNITSIVSNQAKTQSSDLFTIFTERSYTATVDSLGNLMIQPLMFFDLVNIPLFYGNYWITNVKHSITPNDIKTTFKGVRQPVSVLPSKSDVLMQLAEREINGLLDTNITISDNQDNGGGGQNQPESVYISMDEISFDELLNSKTNDIVTVGYSNDHSWVKGKPIDSLFETDLYKHLIEYGYLTRSVPYAALKGFLSLESFGGDPLAYNEKTGAAGIIQFMPETAQEMLVLINKSPALTTKANSDNIKLNTKPALLTSATKANNKAYFKTLNLTQQIFLTKVFFGAQKGGVRNASHTTIDKVWRCTGSSWGSMLQIYTAIFFPAALDHWSDKNWVFVTKKLTPGLIAKQNPAYSNDPNNPKYITVSTFSNAVMKTLIARYYLV